MIKYEKEINKYYYDSKKLDNIIDLLKKNDYYENCSKDKVLPLIGEIDDFISSIKIVREKALVERHETEEEARDYFGKDFITKFDSLLTKLDQEQTILAIHGTNLSTCPKICEDGLRYLYSNLHSTAVAQDMAYGEKEMHYDKYEELLNWKHKDYKGLVMIAVPYECYYKEGLWNHFQNTGQAVYGAQDYKIDPDFIVGYLDVSNKKIILNPKYSREHDYTNYEKDNDIFHENKDLDNDKLTKIMVERNKSLGQEEYSEPEVSKEDDEIDEKRIPDLYDGMNYTFNSIKLASANTLSEEKYKNVLTTFSKALKTVPYLKTEEEIEKEAKEKATATPFNSLNNKDFGFDDDFFADDLEWEDTSFDTKKI